MQNLKSGAPIGIALYLAMASILFGFHAVASENGGNHWAQYDPESKKAVEYNPLINIMRFVAVPNDPSKLNLAALEGPARQYVTQYREYLQSIPVSTLNKDEQLAFWLNTRNVLVIEKLSANLDDLRKLKKHVGSPQQPGEWWTEKLITVEGHALSISDIEQNVLAKNWEDPTYIYGLYYAVEGDAFESAQVFDGRFVHDQLGKLAKEFLNDKDNVRISRGKVRLSSLLHWHKESLFNNSDEALLAHVRSFADVKNANKLTGVSQISDKDKFSWKSSIYSPPRNRTATYGESSRGGGGGGGVYRGGS